jgi:hypothetical protein
MDVTVVTAAWPAADDLAALSWHGDSERSLAAAERILSSDDTDAELDRWYPLLLGHRALPVAAHHLARAGGDLERLTVGSRLYRSMYPLNAILPPPPPVDRLPIAHVLAALDRHQQLLGGVLAELCDRDPGGFAALFGRAIRLAHPAYRLRLDHDIDLYAPDVPHGLRLVDVLSTMGFVLQNMRVSRVRGRWVAHLSAFRVHESGHKLYVDVLAGGRPSGPGLRPPWLGDALLERARPIVAEGVEVLVPAPEDMLLLLADKAMSRKVPDFTRRHCNDGRVVLVAHDGSLDADLLVREARAAGTAAALDWFVSDAEAAEGRPLLPPAPRAALRPGQRDAALVRAAAEAPLVEKHGQGRQAARAGAAASAAGPDAMRALGRRWVRHYVRMAPSAAAAARELAADRARRWGLQLGQRAARAPVGRLLRRMDPGQPRALVFGTVPKRAPAQGMMRTNLPIDGTPSGDRRNSR